MRTGSVRVAGALAAGVALVWLLPAGVAGQSAAAPKARARADTAPIQRTPWGDPDLQGIWSNTTTTPFERPVELSDKTVLTEEERAALARQVAERLDADRRIAQPGQIIAYNEFWYERGTLTNRPSLIIDPADGKLPPFTPEGQKRWDTMTEHRKKAPESWLDRSPYDRCITRGMPGAMMPGFYNHNYQILQTPGYVVILVEMIHDARIIPVDGRPHLPADVRQWLGDSRGRWEGRTLVVETRNLNDKYFERGAGTGFGGNLKMTERFTRVDADTIDYQFTIDDPTTFTRPWTVAAPMSRIEGPLFEYACHEGNYALVGILGGGRAEEKAAATEGAARTVAGPSLVGAWKINPAKSTYSPSTPTDKSQTSTWEALGGGQFKNTIDIVDAKGQSRRFELVLRFDDGVDYPMKGADQPTTRTYKRLNDLDFEYVQKVNGKVTLTSRSVTSPDGKTRTNTTTGTDAQGQPVKNVVHWERQ
jgi:hypothetical protein